jgi:hypothetical protein
MALDLRGFVGEQNQWAGLYHGADQLEKRKLRADQLAMQQQARRSSTSKFLESYLDPKELLTGTTYDPMILKGLQSAMQQGSQLINAGADESMLMMALGPMVNKLSTYSANAKNVNRQIDERIKGMRDSGLTGYNYANLRDEALRNAFYTKGADGQLQLNPDGIDLSQDYVQKAIHDNPLAVTTEDVFDEFSKKSDKFETLADVTTYTPTGGKTKSRAQLIAADYMVPEVDSHGVTTGFVPKHQIATDQGNPLVHAFQQDGKTVNAPIRLLDEEFYNKGMKPAMQDRIRGMVQQRLQEYTQRTGKQVDIDSPQAKDLGRAFAYDMLNVASRKGGSIRHVENKNQPSPAMVNLRIQQMPEYRQNTYNKAADARAGRLSVPDPNDPDQYKRNVGEAIGDIFTGKEDLSGITPDTINGSLFDLDGTSKKVENYKAIDVTSSMPGGGLRSGGGAKFDYKRVFFNPDTRSLVVEQEEPTKSGKKSYKFLEIPESKVGQFINRVAEANNIDKRGVRALLDKIGYKGNKFGGSTKAAPSPAGGTDEATDFDKRAAGKPSWRKAWSVNNPFGQ